MIWILLLVVFGILAYAVYKYYQSTPADQSVPKRLLAAVAAFGAAAAATATHWLHSAPSP